MDEQLIRDALKSPDQADLAERIRREFSAADLKDGSAVASDRGRFLWALESEQKPHLYIDDSPAPRMRRLSNGLWFHAAELLTGVSHAHYYRVAGKILGGARFDTAALTEDSYPQEGVPAGEVSEAMVHESQVYQGWKVSWWVYASPGVKPNEPAPVMNWFDGHRFLYRDSGDRLPVVTENLVAQGKIPPMIHVMVSPTVIEDHSGGTPSDARGMRSLLYDTVNDDYNKMIFGEIYPKVETMYKLRRDGYSVATGGQSSGGIGAFNMAWQRPAEVSRVLSRIGTYTSIQWRYGQPNPDDKFGFEDPAGHMDGGNIFPFLIRKRPKKNLRVWLSDGAHDLENEHGSWPLQNIQMANSLKMQGYDFFLHFGNNQHNTTLGASELPRALTWLWRDYDPAKTEQTYRMDPDEAERPYYRVGIVNR